MPKIKLKPHLDGIEIGIGNLVNLKIEPGETAEIAEEFLGDLLGLGHFDIVDEEEKPKKKKAEEGNE
jgi:hypothetical protein